MKNVCIVMEKHTSLHMGGAELQADLLARELASRPDVRVHYLTRGAAPAGKRTDHGYEIVTVGSSRGNLRKRAVFFDGPELTRTLRRIRPQAIYQRMKQGYTGICARYAKAARIPMVFHAALDLDLVRATRRDRPIANLPFDFVESVLGNWGVRNASTLVVQTTRQASLAASGYDRHDAVIVPNFQPLPGSLPAKDNPRTCVLWVANIHNNKRPERFLELASKLSHRQDVEFVMIGRPNEHWVLGGGMAAITGSPHVKYLGQLPIEEVNRWMDRADIFVNTSSVEGFPNTFIQAWSRGAVVVSETVDIDRGLQEQGVGLHGGDFPGLVQAVERLLDSTDLRRQLQQRAFAYVWSHHSMANAVRLADLVVTGPQSNQDKKHGA